MNHDSFIRKGAFLRWAVILAPLLFFPRPSNAQSPQKKNGAHGEMRSDVRNIQQQLVRIESGFFEAWKTKDQAYFREHMSENSVFWGEYGTFSREQVLAEQLASAKTCTVDGYGLSDFGALPLAAGVYLLTYKAEQYATCDGEKVPVHMNGSSVYVLKAGRWQAIYRAEVPLKNPS